jgi:hypothetical protein
MPSVSDNSQSLYCTETKTNKGLPTDILSKLNSWKKTAQKQTVQKELYLQHLTN